MQTVATFLPEGLELHQGEEIQFQALVQADGSLLVTRVLHRENPKTSMKPTISLADWGRMWAGAIALEPDGSNADTRSSSSGYWSQRKLLPAYEALLLSGTLASGTDSSVMISEEREAR